ncbi:MAG TPA: choice-of-anchor B family protein [Acidimicrobiales bacterium]|nr:choice-of-anchor B family protein [Acidimicrobiales bacterium]
MDRMLRSRRAWASGLALAALLAGAVVSSPLADAHPDPLETSHKQQAAGGVVVRVQAPSELAADLAAVQWGDTAPIEDQSGPLVYAGSGCSPLSYAAVDVAGKVAFIDDEATTDPCPVSTFAQKVQSAQQAGAIALVSLPAEGSEPNGSATALAGEIPALELYRVPEAVAVRDALLAGTAVSVALADTREPLPRIVDQPCVDGTAGPFACDGVDLLSFVPQEEFDGAGVSDIWGWTDPETSEEYVMFGKTNGVAFYNVTDPYAPLYVGWLPNEAVLQEIWHDIKVFQDHAFIVSESMPHGMTVFDLTELRGVTEAQELSPTARYDGVMSAHNVAINEETGFAYIVGGNAALVAPDQCLSGLHMVDINDPANPTFAGCHPLDGGPGTAARTVGLPVGVAYVHDTQCVVYRGPDADHQGREICFNAAEDKVAIVDVTDKPLGMRTISTIDYEDVAYAHQGWLTEDQRYLLTNDELDEQAEPGTRTRTMVLDVSDLDAPVVHDYHHHDTVSIDHNNYVHEGLVYQSNYTSGLRVLGVATLDDPADPRLDPRAFFDVYPYDDEDPQAVFEGTWSNYPYFESGTIAVTGINEGLFLLRLSDDEPATSDEGPGRGKGRRGPPEGRGPKG